MQFNNTTIRQSCCFTQKNPGLLECIPGFFIVNYFGLPLPE